MERPKRNLERARRLAAKTAEKLNQQPQPTQPPASQEPQTPQAAQTSGPQKGKVIRFQPPRTVRLRPASSHKNKKKKPARAVKISPPSPNSEVELRIQAIRRRRSRRKMRWFALIGGICILFLAWATGLYGASLSLLGDVVEGFQVALDQSGSWPARTGVSDPLQVEELRGGVMILGREDLQVYSPTGARLRSIQHGYGRPVVTVGSNRFCLYNRAGTQLRVESRTKSVATLTTEEPIILCQLSGNGSLAVVTQSQRNAAKLTVYSRDMLPIYQWELSDAQGVPVRVAFSSNNKMLAVACLVAQEGQLVTQIHFAKLTSTEEPLTIQVPGSTVIHLEWLSGSSLLALYDNQAALYNSQGAQTAVYDYQGYTLEDYSLDGKKTALLLSTTAGSKAVTLDRNLQEGMALSVEAASQITYASGVVYLVRDESIVGYNSQGIMVQKQTFDAVPRALVKARSLLVFTDGLAEKLASGIQE